MNSKQEEAIKKLRVAYMRIGGAIASIEQAKKRPCVGDDDLLRAHVGIAKTNLEGVRELIAEAGKLLK